jgi:hypothetical protein
VDDAIDAAFATLAGLTVPSRARRRRR